MPSFKIGTKYKIVAGLAVLFAACVVGVRYLSTVSVALFQPRGTVARQELHLLYFGLLLSLIVVVPVFILFGMIIWRYRASNTRAKYAPELDGNRKLETIWWLVPGLIILVLSVVTWQSTHSLDPYRSLASTKQPLEVQVVALDWRWLFIYPEQHIASVNFMQFPVDRPVNFTITADAPMNSFWIPQLGGQVYAMPGMLTELHLSASQAGDYRGVSANISGKGFANMHFTARAGSPAQFADWVTSMQQSPLQLDGQTYDTLRKPSTNTSVMAYSKTDATLYGSIVEKYMASDMSGMGM